MHFRVSCEVFYYYDHLIEPVEKIAKLLLGEADQDTRTENIGPVEFKAGEQIGYSRGVGHNHRFDFGVINNSLEPVLIDDPEYANSETANADCPLNYYSGEMESKIRELVEYERMSDATIIDNLCD